MQGREADSDRILLDLLTSVEHDGAQSQRRLAAELGIALGLVNAYLKRCVKKGLLKVGEAPARRYAYYLTPQGFAEKSRLTVEYLSNSFSFFRRAKDDCLKAFALASARGCRKLVLAGKSDLAEIAVLCAVEAHVEIVAIWDEAGNGTHFVGIPLVSTFGAIDRAFDGIVITDVKNPLVSFDLAVAACGAEHVFAPDLLGLRVAERRESA